MLTRQLLQDFATDLGRTAAMGRHRWLLRRENRRALGYIGWVGHNNLGDEVMFDAIRHALRRFPISDLLPSPGEHTLLQCGLGGKSIFKAILLGGGTLINSLYLPVARQFVSMGLPLYTVGTGVGSPGFGINGDGDHLTEWTKLLRTSPLISVRGPLSKEVLNAHGLDQVEVIGDPALALTPDDSPPFRSRKRLVINLTRTNAEPDQESYRRFVGDAAAIARQFVAEGGQIVGAALGAGDHSALETFRQQSGLSTMLIEDHRRSGVKLIETLRGSYGCLCIRLHASVLAASVGVPSVLLAYRSKCRDFMCSMEAESLAIPLSHSSLARERFQQVLADSDMGPRLYQRALFWKRKQEDFYQRLSTQIDLQLDS